MTTQAAAATALSTDECWGKLCSRHFARLAVSVSNQPEIFPLNYVVQDGTILFRTAQGTKLAALTVNEYAALEIDEYTDVGAWSVVVKGRARAIEWGPDLAKAERAGLKPWLPTRKPIYVRLVPEQVSGRRFRFGPEPEAL